MGDDIVISNTAVAKEYVKLCNLIGVKIGLHKSLISEKGTALEFIKRTFYKGTDVSAVPITEYWVAKQMIPASLEFARKYKLSLVSFLDLFSFGYKVKGNLGSLLYKMGRRARDRIVMFYSPYGVKR